MTVQLTKKWTIPPFHPSLKNLRVRNQKMDENEEKTKFLGGKMCINHQTFAIDDFKAVHKKIANVGNKPNFDFATNFLFWKSAQI